MLARELAAQRVARRFGDRWLGLWSASDEALRSLTALAPKGIGYEWVCAADGARGEPPALRDGGHLSVPRLTVPRPVADIHLLPDVLPVAPRRAMTPIIRVVNRWLEPLWRKKIASALTRTCQGADLPAAALAFVSPWPLPLAGAADHPGLPPDTDARLERAAQERTGQLRPVLRQLLMTAALEGVPMAVDAVAKEHGSVAPTALVHTAYFNDPDVGRLIARHICSTATGAGAGYDPAGDDGTARWLAAHRTAVQAAFQRFFDG